VRLLVVGSGAVVTLPDKAEAIVGRADPVSHFYPDVDLQPHGAMDQGVGRRHVRLVVQQQQLLVEDLESTNGSFLNRERLAPRQAAPLQPGDELRLGNMVLQVQH
jgi:pSer/pThr/pTyr-binding forkhead associated (FHA) protein